ncbi:hypothetical protein IAQ61_006004 [Plenodomus lingam]|uniref:uncharacterized protein n=1 Tax=Leptosphaeria maculans TaxID=5022 RepID=UPI003326F376|nr:hypothetical protein IAQ61_006004 [Plenodomus lingam]
MTAESTSARAIAMNTIASLAKEPVLETPSLQKEKRPKTEIAKNPSSRIVEGSRVLDRQGRI